MKLGIITQPNEKGQIVIPKQVRKELHIDRDTLLQIIIRDHGFSVYPIDTIETEVSRENTYTDILRSTQGAWAKDKTRTVVRKKRRAMELKASARRKRGW